MSTREIPFLLCLLTSKTASDFLYSVVNYSDFANNHNKDEIKELLQPRSPAFGRGVHLPFPGQGRYAPDAYIHTSYIYYIHPYRHIHTHNSTGGTCRYI